MSLLAAMIRFALPLLIMLLMLPAGAAAGSRAPLQDPVTRNIGLTCQWQQKCMQKQRRAMKRALKYVRKSRPAAWRIQVCNRNAARGRVRVDWIGFDNCIRNADLRRPPPAALKRRNRVTS
jgi:hypothetical protein